MRKIISNLLAVMFTVFIGTIANAQSTTISGTTVPDLLPGNPYASLNAAITALNGVGTITGTVTLSVAAGSETAPAGGYVIDLLAPTSAANNVIITGVSAGSNILTAPNPQAAGSVNDAIFKIIGSDFVTIQNFTMRENALNLTAAPVGSNNMTEFGVALFYKTLSNGAQNNTIQNNIITLNRTNLNTFGIYSNTQHSATDMTTIAEVTAFSGSNSNNKIYGNVIINANHGILFIGAGIAFANMPFMDSGNDIGGSSVVTGNNITNVGGGLRSTAYVGTFTASTYYIFMSQQINNNISYNTVISADLAQGILSGAIINNYVNSPTSGTMTTNINNNTVTITNNPTSGAGAGIVAINSAGFSPLLSTATLNMNFNTVQNCRVGGATSTGNGLTAISNSSNFGNIYINSNSIIKDSISAPNSGNVSLVGISQIAGGNVIQINSNIFRELFSVAAGAGGFITATGINNNPGAGAAGQLVLTSVNIDNNKFGDASGEFYKSTSNQLGFILSIQNTALSPFSTSSVSNNDTRNMIWTNTAVAANIISFNLPGVPLHNIISNNTWTGLSLNTVGTVTIIQAGGTTAVNGTQNINNNSFASGFAITKTGSTGAIVGINATSTAPIAGAIINCNNNNFSGVTIAGSGGFTGINHTAGNTSNKTLSGNTISGVSILGGILKGMVISGGGGAGGNGNMITLNTVSSLSGAAQVTAIELASAGNDC